jgi:tagaturonate reductase
MNADQETILQFGTGKFLRAFADLFVAQANREGQGVGRIVAVQSTGDDRVKLLNQQAGRYHVLIRGLSNGQIVDQVEESRSISRALSAVTQWAEVRAVARSPALHTFISNTAEVGYTLDPADRPDSVPPLSFPAKLTLLLKERFEARLPGLTMLPCELFEQNADVLRDLVLQLVKAWGFSAALSGWIETECAWHNTLVDRIVVNRPAEHPLLPTDSLLCVAEPFAFWAVETKRGGERLFHHPAIRLSADIEPYFLRKVRILNGAHTALVSQALPRGIATVREAVNDPAIAAWLERLLFEEIVPTLQGRVEGPEPFARQVLERFLNPFLDHRVRDIAAYHDAKVKIRLMTTRDEYLQKFGRRPQLLEEAIGWQVSG